MAPGDPVRDLLDRIDATRTVLTEGAEKVSELIEQLRVELARLEASGNE